MSDVNAASSATGRPFMVFRLEFATPGSTTTEGLSQGGTHARCATSNRGEPDPEQSKPSDSRDHRRGDAGRMCEFGHEGRYPDKPERQHGAN